MGGGREISEKEMENRREKGVLLSTIKTAITNLPSLKIFSCFISFCEFQLISFQFFIKNKGIWRILQACQISRKEF